MPALNFSANGTRWRLLIVQNRDSNEIPAELKPLPGGGLLFLTDDREARFLQLTGDVLPAMADLAKKSNAELGQLAMEAPPWPLRLGQQP